MKIPERPVDEEIRLNTLHSLNILDTLPEERFDRITRITKRVFQVPSAMVSLIDKNRQWVKSAVGSTIQETPRDISFCGHSILSDKIMVIPDATQDERFADNPLVINPPYIHFYAGCPLKTPNGSKVGVLCLNDTKARNFSEQDYETLNDLAAIVEQELAITQLATQDELTGLSNRRGFVALAQHSLEINTRQDSPVSLVFIDLNKFKSINDQFGHSEGDHVLSTFAKLMKSIFRNADLLARLGGDEFVILLNNTLQPDAKELMKKFQHSLKQSNQTANRGYDISFSHGVVEFDTHKHSSIEALLVDGDLLMYKQKKQR